MEKGCKKWCKKPLSTKCSLYCGGITCRNACNAIHKLKRNPRIGALRHRRGIHCDGAMGALLCDPYICLCYVRDNVVFGIRMVVEPTFGKNMLIVYLSKFMEVCRETETTTKFVDLKSNFIIFPRCFYDFQ